MGNLNFLPQSFEDRRRSEKIKFYKTIVLLLWICCLVLFILYTFFSNKNKAYNSKNGSIHIGGKLPSLNAGKIKDLKAIETLNTFLSVIEKSIPYKKLSITEDRLELEIKIEDKNQYYEIIDLIESKYKYKILYLSTLTDNNGSLEFKISFEVM
ncbi:hypothetical protein NBE98_18640 [Clostridium swellfunianum]|uniref:hypothetical protein n=1 Tax=Clostridium swellfunianum TaxID=1367462 RepID=UPI00202E933F|nr:hypothetical protein [Clostridium swellfunianum]MCM0650383.1 hypothetical protein [Clostridium swellfunianum]